MSLSRSLSIISAVLALAGCSSDDCGPHGAPVDGLTAMGSGAMLTFSGLRAGPNNDCPDPAAPKGVISLTIDTPPMSTNVFTVCIPRPDKLGHQALAFPGDVKLIDVTGSDASCSYMLDFTVQPTGTLTAAHVCGNGSSSAGFAMTVDAMASLQRTCGTTVDTIPVSLTGTIAVAGFMP
jgi:hypothetical protein